jgi:hypothetical protein
MKQAACRINRHVLALAALCAVAASPAQAALSFYGDSASFNSALTAAGLVGIAQSIPGVADSVVDAGSLVAGPVSFTGLNDGIAASFFVVDGSYGFASTFYSHELFSLDANVNTVLLSFASPVRGFSFVGNVMNPPLGDPINPNNWPDTGMASLLLTTSAGDSVAVASPIFSNYASLPVAPPLGFSAVVSDVAFSSITLSAAQAANLQITSVTLAPVPEPQTLLLMLLGFGVLGWRARVARSGPQAH